MKRSELESLSNAVLRQLVIDATDVLASRAQGAERDEGNTARSGGLFTFGLASNSNSTSGSAPAFGGSSIFSGQSALLSASGSKLFGGTGGGLFSLNSSFSPAPGAGDTDAGAAGAAKPVDKVDGDDDDEVDESELVQEEEVLAVKGWTPSMTLEVRDDLETGEEREEELYCQRSKLYRFRDAEWKERGVGDAKLLKHQVNGKIRFLLRQERTGKVVANHFIVDVPPYCQLAKNAGNETTWVWCAMDYSEDSAQMEQFALRFRDAELAEKFAEAFNDAKKQNSGTEGQEPPPAKS
ncbi:Ranbp2 [Symbiodinium sp. CCMP2456]|nr:Ranbp2 [Symbiodinium sp. CCMP2456]